MNSTRARMVLACVVAISIPLVVAGTATAAKVPTSKAQEKTQNRGIIKNKARITKANASIKTLKGSTDKLAVSLAGTVAGLGTTRVDVDTLKTLSAALPAILTQLGDGLTQVGAGLTAIQAALQNPTTGLVGLNLARPQFGAFDGAGTILGGTGQVAGASGPSTNATKGGAVPDIDGLYVVNFGNDVSKRMYSVNVFPFVPASIGGGGTTPTGEALNCAASVTASGVCGAVAGVASDASPNHVLVQIGDGSSSGAANGFSVTAVSG